MSETKRIGVLGLLRDPSASQTVLFPLLNEGDKWEQVLGYDRAPRRLLSGMWEMVSGAVEPDEDELTALRREMMEERGIGPQVEVKRLQSALEVVQMRNGSQISFGVVMFLAKLGSAQFSEVTGKFPTRIIGDGHLLQELDTLGRESLRPLANAALRLMVESNYWNEI